MKLTGIEPLAVWEKRLGYKTGKWFMQSFCPTPDDFLIDWNTRQRHIATRGFPIITKQCLSRLTTFLSRHKVLDCGAGTGYLVYHLRRQGIDIDGIILRQKHYPFKRTHMKKRLIKGSYLTHDLTPYSAFILSWPDYDHPAACDLLKRLPSGSLLIYQGEDEGGCCANNDFFSYLEDAFDIQPHETRALNTRHIQFYGIHDQWKVCIKR